MKKRTLIVTLEIETTWPARKIGPFIRLLLDGKEGRPILRQIATQVVDATKRKPKTRRKRL